jgi:glycosyltransferase involved in cell wall biosynthesis
LVVCTSWRVFGAETITLRLLEGLKARGHALQAVTSTWTDGAFGRRLATLGVAEVVMPFGALVASLKPRYVGWTLTMVSRLPQLWWQWRRTLQRFRPAVILWTSSRQPFLLLPVLDRTPSVLMEFTGVSPTRKMRWLYGRLARRVHQFVAVSDFMRGRLVGLGAPQETVCVIKSGAFFEREREMTDCMPEARIGQDGPAVLGIVGQISPQKGHEDLIEAVRLLKARGFPVRVRVFGSGDTDYVRRLKQKIAAAGLGDQFEWMGYERDKVKIFGSVDVCVVPSCFGDPFPTVAMEAAAYRRPVVATRDGGLPEIVEDGVTGWLVEVHAPGALADKIEWLVRNPERARAMGVAGRERVFRLFTVEKMTAQFEALFQRLVGTRTREGGGQPEKARQSDE